MEAGMDADVNRLIHDASARLRAAGVDTPEYDAKLLLADACGVELRDIDKALLMRDDLGRLTHAAPSPVIAAFRGMVERRAGREPLQYIVGHAPFRYLDLMVGPGVFIPRPETEIVVQAGLDWLGRQRRVPDADRTVSGGRPVFRVADLCAGSGAVGLSIATETADCEVWAVELDERTAAWTRRNAEAVLGKGDVDVSVHDHAASDRPSYHLVLGDATAPTTLAALDGTVDLIATNPPYVPESAIPEQPEVRDHDPELALYGGSPDGLLIPGRIIGRASRLLRPGGALVMEHDIGQGDALIACARGHGFVQARTGDDLTGRPRYLFAIR